MLYQYSYSGTHAKNKNSEKNIQNVLYLCKITLSEFEFKFKGTKSAICFTNIVYF
jgi:hypothetical protein